MQSVGRDATGLHTKLSAVGATFRSVVLFHLPRGASDTGRSCCCVRLHSHEQGERPAISGNPMSGTAGTGEAGLPIASGDRAHRDPTPGEVLATLLEVRAAALGLEDRLDVELDRLPSALRPSGANLLHYLALRQFDLRREQPALARWGLSSLGRAESRVLATLDAVIDRLLDDLGWHDPLRGDRPPDLGQHRPGWSEAARAVAEAADAALGPEPSGHATRIMVTLPGEAAHDAKLVGDLVDAGMTIARINGAHDGPGTWLAMAEQVRAAGERRGRPVRICFDLAGPKLRTGPVPDHPGRVRIRPERDASGAVLAPGRVDLVAPFRTGPDRTAAAPDPPPGTVGDVSMTVDAALVVSARPGDELRLRDARGRRRTLGVQSVDRAAVPPRLSAVALRSVHLGGGQTIECWRDDQLVAVGTTAALAPEPGWLGLDLGDHLVIWDDGRQATEAVRDDAGNVVGPAVIGCEVPGSLRGVQPGHRVLLDDGTIRTVALAVHDDHVVVEVRHPRRAKLRAEKGVNLPDSVLRIPALTEDDQSALAVVAPVVDLVSLSFVDDPADVSALHALLDELGRPDLGVVLKVERRTAFEALPELLLEAMRRPPVAVMVARGDLAAEVGFERLAELQEEILWLSEAAHVPVIWATQVLESLAKEGAPTRAEVTDAAWSVRAECVMLNKGPHVVEAVRMLDDVLTRMQGHQHKRTPQMRPLAVASAWRTSAADTGRDGV